MLGVLFLWVVGFYCSATGFGLLSSGFVRMEIPNESTEKSARCGDVVGGSNQHTPSCENSNAQSVDYSARRGGDVVKYDSICSSHCNKENNLLNDLDGSKFVISNSDVQGSEPRSSLCTQLSSKVSRKRSFARNISMVSSSLLQQFEKVYEPGKYFFDLCVYNCLGLSEFIVINVVDLY